MALIATEDVRCATCAHAFTVTVRRSIGPTERPAVLADRLHRVACPACGQALRHETPLTYLDPHTGDVVWVRPPEDEAGWSAWAHHASAGLAAVQRAGAWQGPPARLRLVFGLDALREKLVVHAAGLDDALVELVKRGIALRRPRVADGLRVRAVTSTGLQCVGPGTPGLVVPHAQYARLAAQRDALAAAWPALFAGPWVDAALLTRSRG